MWTFFALKSFRQRGDVPNSTSIPQLLSDVLSAAASLSSKVRSGPTSSSLAARTLRNELNPEGAHQDPSYQMNPSTVSVISTPYSDGGKGAVGAPQGGKKERPTLRRPNIALVERAEAEVAAAKALKASTPPPDISKVAREEAEGAEQAVAESGAKEDFSDLRCSSVTTEEVAAKVKRAQRQNRCPDYPGLAFGAPLGFGSDTMMKFNIIKNELHNIMRSQLKRVDGEVAALSERIRTFDENLEKSEKFIKTATTTLAEAVQLETERKKQTGDEEEDAEDEGVLSQFDAQMALLEGKLLQAKILVEESDNPSNIMSTTSPKETTAGLSD